jgi:hypothetical protein
MRSGSIQSFVGPSPQQTPVFNRGIFGCGEIAAIADTAQDYDSCYFRDTVNGVPPVSTCSAAPCPAAGPRQPAQGHPLLQLVGRTRGRRDNCAGTITGSSGHGTHTSGSIAGDNAPYADCAGHRHPARNGGDGAAPGAKLVIQEMGDSYEYLNDLGGTLWNLTDVAFQNGARIHSNSWGGACYDIFGTAFRAARCRTTRTRATPTWRCGAIPDLLVVVAAGNGGISTARPPVLVGTPANAKSVLAVGSVDHGVDASTPSDFTSAGPRGRRPLGATVAAQGLSTVSGRHPTRTSRSQQLHELLARRHVDVRTHRRRPRGARPRVLRDGIPGGGNAQSGAGFSPSGALVKATLIDARRGARRTAPGPDFVSGFGRVQLDRTLAFSGARSSSASTITARGCRPEASCSTPTTSPREPRFARRSSGATTPPR